MVDLVRGSAERMGQIYKYEAYVHYRAPEVGIKDS